MRPPRISPRRRLEIAIERAITLLDTMDGDPDLEDGADDEDGADKEPSLCGVGMAVSGGQGVYHGIAHGLQYDLEQGAALL